MADVEVLATMASPNDDDSLDIYLEIETEDGDVEEREFRVGGRTLLELAKVGVVAREVHDGEHSQ